MFPIDANNLPFVRTRQALLVLDLQNDFVSPGAILPVHKPTDFVNTILELAPDFRASGDVIWIRTCYVASRKVNEPYGESEHVITDAELNLEARGGEGNEESLQLSKILRQGLESTVEGNGKAAENGPVEVEEVCDDGQTVKETYLDVKPGQEPRVVLAMSPNTNFTHEVLSSLDVQRDLIFQKTWYSAFRDGSLVQILRAKFVTEIYICGALTNISVFATAMDAARHGYGITIVEDCLGYRSKARHDEALRRLAVFTGCDIMTSKDLREQLQEKARRLQAPPRSQPRRPQNNNSGLERLMSNLNLRQDRPPASKKAIPKALGLPENVAVESAGNSQRAESNDSDDPQLPSKATAAEGKKRERVRAKIKSRRRPSNPTIPVVKESAATESSEKSLSVTAATLDAATEVLAQLPKPIMATEDTASSSESSAGSHANVKVETDAATSVNSNGAIAVHPDYAVDGEQDSLSEEETGGALCEGDTNIIKNILPSELAEGIFERIRDEVRWQKMSHQGGEVPRLVAVQGEVAKDGSIPIYRHPADESPTLLPFSETVSLIRKQVEKHLGHRVNHVLIQFYRNGTDYISEHSDKTLDISPDTFIANVSLGAQRTMVFRTKKQKETGTVAPETVVPRKACRSPLPHNSMCKMGLATNMRWLHGIRQDKRLASEKMAEELAYQGGRISLTFRKIGTFLEKDQQKIWGQGAVAKTKEMARTILNGNTPEAEKMIRAFGQENHSSEFDWKAVYGGGFDVLHISNTPKLFLSGDVTADLRVKLYLAEHNIEWTEGKLSPPFTWKDGISSKAAPDIPETLPIKFVDNDLSKSTVVGDVAIMLYLDAVYGDKADLTPKAQVDIARQYTRLQQSAELLKKWRTEPFSVKPFQREFKLWEAYALESPYMAGSSASLADFALFPIVEEIRTDWKNADGMMNVVAWYLRIRHRPAVMKVMGPLDKDSLTREKELEGNAGVKTWD